MNIRQVAKEVTGAVVKPGDTFSLNGYTGTRGTAQGYVESGIIIDGHSGTAVGGGISQFAITLFNASYFAGMTDVHHQEHSYYISRYPAAREATVYEGAIDLKFSVPTKTGIPDRGDRRRLVDHGTHLGDQDRHRGVDSRRAQQLHLAECGHPAQRQGLFTVQRRAGFYHQRHPGAPRCPDGSGDLPQDAHGELRPEPHRPLRLSRRARADQKEASSSFMIALSTFSTIVRLADSSGSTFLAKNDATATLPL